MMPLFVVETIEMFRARYIVECKSLEHAFDTVTCGEPKRVSNMCLGENIVSGREISSKELQDMVHKMDNGYGDGTRYQPEIKTVLPGCDIIHKVIYD